MPPTPVSLKGLAESKTAGITKSTTFRVDPDLVILEDGFNLRLASKELADDNERLFLAMKEGAFIPPIDVVIVEGRIICRDGHRRTTAAQRLKAEDLPEYTLEARQLRGNDSDAVLHMLGTGSGGRPLSPLEQGLGYLRLVKLGLAVVDIAKKLGTSRVTVDKGITLAEAPMEVQKMVQRGEVSATTAIGAVKQGKEGVAALKSAVQKHREKPTKKKNGQAKKVTAKTLRGTKADKSAGKKTRSTATPPDAGKDKPTPDKITIELTRESAKEVLELIEGFASTADMKLMEAKSVIQFALM
jgi:ParB-like chromosome segregation protein Spo0J